jgi:hypothetical protein
VLVTLVFGLLNVANWIMNTGRTGVGVRCLLVLAIPFASGMAVTEAPWFVALIMALPVLRAIGLLPYGLAVSLILYVLVFVVYFALVYAGYALRVKNKSEAFQMGVALGGRMASWHFRELRRT